MISSIHTFSGRSVQAAFLYFTHRTMHGRSKALYKIQNEDPAYQKKVTSKLSNYVSLCSTLNAMRAKKRASLDRNCDYDGGDVVKSDGNDEKFSGLLDILNVVNPDYYTLWNCRRELLLGKVGEGGGHDAVVKENDVTYSALKKNYKSYPAWFHRKWSTSHYIATSDVDICAAGSAECEGDRIGVVERLLKHSLEEREATEEWLDLDERNFHCWNYRCASCFRVARLRILCSECK